MGVRALPNKLFAGRIRRRDPAFVGHVHPCPVPERILSYRIALAHPTPTTGDRVSRERGADRLGALPVRADSIEPVAAGRPRAEPHNRSSEN